MIDVPRAVTGAVLLARLLELWLSARNERRLRAIGAIESGAAQYRWTVLFHAAWFVALFLCIPRNALVRCPWLALFAAAFAGRLWVMATLRERWTTRILTVPGAHAIVTGPYRFLRHPNSWVVCVELAALPLAFGAWAIAVAASLVHLPLIVARNRTEDAALGRPR